jgi:hypothetical protein
MNAAPAKIFISQPSLDESLGVAEVYPRRVQAPASRNAEGLMPISSMQECHARTPMSSWGFAESHGTAVGSVPHHSAMKRAMVPVMRFTDDTLTHSSRPWMLREIGP